MYSSAGFESGAGPLSEVDEGLKVFMVVAAWAGFSCGTEGPIAGEVPGLAQLGSASWRAPATQATD